MVVWIVMIMKIALRILQGKVRVPKLLKELLNGHPVRG